MIHPEADRDAGEQSAGRDPGQGAARGAARRAWTSGGWTHRAPQRGAFSHAFAGS
jgi:hypothetical protein